MKMIEVALNREENFLEEHEANFDISMTNSSFDCYHDPKHKLISCKIDLFFFFVLPKMKFMLFDLFLKLAKN